MPVKSNKEKDYDFFISYSNGDVALVEPVVRALEREYRARCWFQLNNSRQEYVNEIIEGIENSHVFIIFVSKNSAMSTNVLNELAYAFSCYDNDDDYQILPIVIEDDDFNINGNEGRKMRFYLNRINMLFCKRDTDKHSIISQIFSQVQYVLEDDLLQESLYRTSEIEEIRLLAQNSILNKASNYIFEQLVSEDSVILDVGCAGADNIMLRLEGLKYGRLLGVDYSADRIAAANKDFANEKNTFIECNINDEDFDDLLRDYLEGINASGFDVIHISSVLLHQTEPVKILKVLRKLLKNSGSIFIQEEDDDISLVYPPSAFFDNALKIWLDSKESGDRHCAKKLPSYLKAAGFKNIKLEKCGITNLDFDESDQEAFWDIYFNYHLWEGLSGDLFYNRDKTMKLVEDYINDYEKHHEDFLSGKYFVQQGFLFFVARK